MFKTTNFMDDIGRGKVGERIFIDDFLKFLNIKYKDVTNCQKFQIIDSDYLSTIGSYEVKMNYKDNEILIIEEYTNINQDLGRVSQGWFYKSGADMLVFISKATHTMILIPFTDKFKEKYNSIKINYKLNRNYPSKHNGNRWQSAYRRIPLDVLSGYYSYYKRG